MIEYFKERNLQGLQKALKMGEDWDTEDSLPVQDVLDILKELGCIINDSSFESNGYQYDWWHEFVFQGVTFYVGGCGYHGKLSIMRKEEI